MKKPTRREALALFGQLGLAAGSMAFLGTSALTLSGCAQGETVPEYVSPYDWTGLFRDGEKMIYLEDGILCSRWGFDVSEHQHDVDWTAVASAGLDFAFVRIGNRGATEGKLNTDQYFMANCAGATKIGLPLSGYYFSQAITNSEAREEAHYALEQVRNAEKTFGCVFEAIAYDHEAVHIDGARANDLPNEQLSANVMAFCDVISEAGYRALLYGNQRDLLKVDPRVRDVIPVWLAEYDVPIPTAPLDFIIWQYTNSGTIPGVPTDVDLNIWFTPLKEDEEPQ